MTIVERVRCLISSAKRPKYYWGIALSTAAYLINLSPSYPLHGYVPNKVYYGKDILYDHLNVQLQVLCSYSQYGRSNLDSKTQQCILLSYGGDQFGYKLCDPIAIKVVRSSEVRFAEDKITEDIVKKKEHVLESIMVGVPP
jgi:hypothetical protein